jgi:hypothetical protein
LVEPTRKLVRSNDPAIQAGAISGLIRLLDDTVATRVFVRGLLRSPNPAVRGRAAEYLGWHVGDDAAWQQDHETVVAIGPGIVRSVDLGQKPWGGLVVIEHASAAGGRFCSLYGHLGPLVSVQPGQIVRQGGKVGAVVPSYSHANGGYLAHLHLS